MAINITSRKIKVLISGNDYSDNVSEISNWSVNSFDESGLYKYSATLSLFSVYGDNRSLDDRDNLDFSIGNTIEIYVSTTKGNLQLHPYGRMRVLSSEYNIETGKLTLNVACLLTILSFKQGTNVDDIAIDQTKGLTYNRRDYIRELLVAAGIKHIDIVCPSLPHPINYVINPDGGYIDTAGKIAFSAGYYLYQDNHEKIIVKPINISPQPISEITIGEDELWYKRLQSSEGVRETIKTTSQVSLLTPNDYNTETWSGNTQNKTTFVNNILTEDVFYYQTENDFTKTFIGGNRTIKYFDTNDEGKINKLEYFEYKLNTEVAQEYVNAKLQEDPPSSFFPASGTIITKKNTTNYNYNTRSQLILKTTDKLENKLSLLNGTNHDWSGYSLPPTGLINSGEIYEAWVEVGGKFAHTYRETSPAVRLNSSLATPDVSETVKLRIVPDYSTNKANGNEDPPAPERRPPAVTYNTINAEGTFKVSQIGSNPYKERERTYTIEYHEGLTGNINSYPEGTVISTVQTKKAAQLFATFLYGRYKGYDIGIDLKDFVFNISPQQQIVVRESTGKRRLYLIDDIHFHIEDGKSICNFGLVWLGDLPSNPVVSNIVLTGDVLVGSETLNVQPTVTNLFIGDVIQIPGGFGSLGEYRPPSWVTVTKDIPIGSFVIPILPSPFTFPVTQTLSVEKNESVLPFITNKIDIESNTLFEVLSSKVYVWGDINNEWNTVNEAGWNQILEVPLFRYQYVEILFRSGININTSYIQPITITGTTKQDISASFFARINLNTPHRITPNGSFLSNIFINNRTRFETLSEYVVNKTANIDIVTNSVFNVSGRFIDREVPINIVGRSRFDVTPSYFSSININAGSSFSIVKVGFIVDTNGNGRTRFDITPSFYSQNIINTAHQFNINGSFISTEIITTNTRIDVTPIAFNPWNDITTSIWDNLFWDVV